MKKLTSNELKSTSTEPMTEIEILSDSVLAELDEYMFDLFTNKSLKESEYENTFIDHMYKSGDDKYVHIIFSIKKGHSLTLVIDNSENTVYGHYFKSK